MPNVKCRYYTEDGEPKQGGCRRHNAGNCPFVHPDSSAWVTAAPASSKPGSSKGGGRITGGSRHAQGTRKGGGKSGSGLFSGMHDPSENAVSSSGWGNLADGNLESSSGGWDTGGGGGRDNGTESGWGTGGRGGGGVDSGGDWTMRDTFGGGVVKSSSGSPPRHGWGNTIGWDSAVTGRPGESEEASTPWWTSTDAGRWGSESANANTKRDKGKGKTDWPPKQDDTSTKASETPMFYGTIWADGQPSGQNLPLATPTGTDNRKTKLPPHSADIDAGMDPPRKLTGTNQVLLGTKKKWGSDAIHDKDADMEDSTTTHHPATSNVPLPTPLQIQPYPIVDPGDTPLTPAAPAIGPPRPKRKREGLDEKRETFKEYIKTWERAVRAKFHLAEAELNRDRWYRTRKSPCYSRIGDAGINILESKHAEFDREYFAQREKLSLAVTALVDYQETVMSGYDLVQRYDISEETNRFIAESTAYARQIRTLIEDFKNRDVPMRDPSPSPSAGAGLPPDGEWEALQRRVEEMEESLEQIDAELTLSRPMDIRDMVDNVFDARMSELREARKQEVQRMATRARPEIVIPPDSLEKLEESATRWQEVERRLPKTIGDISDLIVGNAQFANRLEQLEKENVGHREALAKLQDKYTATEELRRQKEKLQEDLDELMHQPRFAPRVPVENTCRQLIEELKPAVVALVQKIYEQEIVPAVGTMGEVITGVPNCKQTEASRPQEHLRVPSQD